MPDFNPMGNEPEASPAIQMLKAAIAAGTLGGIPEALARMLIKGHGSNALVNNARTIPAGAPGNTAGGAPAISGYLNGAGGQMSGLGNSLFSRLSSMGQGALGATPLIGAALGAGGLAGAATGIGQQSSSPAAAQIEQQMQALVAQGVPASQAWRQIFGDAPLDGDNAQSWGLTYQNMGGVNDLTSGQAPGGAQAAATGTPPPAAGAMMPPMTPTATNTPTPTPTGMGTPLTSAPVLPFEQLSPANQAAAIAEHGPQPGGMPSPTPSASATPAASVAAVASPSPSPSVMATPGATPSASPSATPSATPSTPSTPSIGMQAGGGAPVPGQQANPDLMGYLYDILNPERSIGNVLHDQMPSMPTYGPGYEWLKSYLAPAQAQAIAGGNMSAEGFRDTLGSRLNGSAPGMAPGDILNSLSQGEQSARTAMSANPGMDLRLLWNQAQQGDQAAQQKIRGVFGGDAGAQKAAYMSYVNQSDPAMAGNLLAASMASGDKHMSTGLMGLVGQMFGNVLQNQVNQGFDVGPGAGQRLTFLKSLIGY